jgi:hypothetical protein
LHKCHVRHVSGTQQPASGAGATNAPKNQSAACVVGIGANKGVITFSQDLKRLSRPQGSRQSCSKLPFWDSLACCHGMGPAPWCKPTEAARSGRRSPGAISHTGGDCFGTCACPRSRGPVCGGRPAENRMQGEPRSFWTSGRDAACMGFMRTERCPPCPCLGSNRTYSVRREEFLETRPRSRGPFARGGRGRHGKATMFTLGCSV